MDQLSAENVVGRWKKWTSYWSPDQNCLAVSVVKAVIRKGVVETREWCHSQRFLRNRIGSPAESLLASQSCSRLNKASGIDLMASMIKRQKMGV